MPRGGPRRALIASGIVTAALYWIPLGRWVLYPLLLLSTLAHETGHGLAALLAGGSFQRLALWPDGSGVAEWSAADPGRIATAWVAAGGLLGPALGAGLGFAAARTARGARLALLGGAAFSIALLVLFVRNAFAGVFLILLASALVALRARATASSAQWSVLFLSLQLALSVFSRSDYLFTRVALTSAGEFPSDVEQMAHALFLPYWFWGALCGLLSVAIVVVGVRRTVR